MNTLSMFPINRLRWLLLPAILAVFGLASLFTTVAQAENCLYEVHGSCLETTPDSNVNVLQRNFVIEHVDNVQRIYDVWIMAARPDIFDQVLQPIRSQSPDLQQYNNQFLIRATGEIGERDLQGAINQGLVREISRILLDERCNTPVISKLAAPARQIPNAAPWRVEIAPTDVLTTYMKLQTLAPGAVPGDPSGAEQTLVPEGMIATFLVADEVNMKALIEFLNFD